jgi:hypothetical protein
MGAANFRDLLSMQAKPVTLAAMYVGFKTFCWTFVGSMLIGQCAL